MKKSTDWEKIRLEFVNGSMTYEDLAKKHKIQSSTVRKQANRATPKWEAQRHALSQQVTQAAQSLLIDKRQKLLEEINQADINLSKAIRNQIADALKDAQDKKDPVTGETIKGKKILAKDLRSLAAAAESAQRLSRLAIGASTENHELAGPNGGPVATTAIVPRDEDRYLAARARVLNKY